MEERGLNFGILCKKDQLLLFIYLFMKKGKREQPEWLHQIKKIIFVLGL
jgi:hypothetical protein